MLEGLSPMHLLLVLVVVLIVFGPGKLPEVGAALGRGVREMRNALSGIEPTPRDLHAAEPVASAPTPATPPEIETIAKH